MSGADPVTSAPDTARILDAVRTRRPLVHCLTNSVTVSRVADALAAVGARPVMASALEEVEDMASHADGLLLNLGTPDHRRWSAARSAAGVARQRRVPIVVDPVGCGATAWRTAQSRALVTTARADIIRGSAPEVAVLANLPPPRAGSTAWLPRILRSSILWRSPPALPPRSGVLWWLRAVRTV